MFYWIEHSELFPLITYTFALRVVLDVYAHTLAICKNDKFSLTVTILSVRRLCDVMSVVNGSNSLPLKFDIIRF